MQRTLKRRWIVCGALMLISASAVLAKQAIVKTKDGRSFEGDVTEKANGVVITVRGISTTINRDDVDTVQYVGSIEDQYKERLAKLPKNPIAADHVAIAKWLFDNHSYDLAMKEIEASGRLDPNNVEAATLEQTILSQKRLERSRPGTPTVGANTGGTGTTPVGPRIPEGGHVATEHKYVSAEDINTIRQMEWPKDDNTVRATVPPDLRKRYIAYAGVSPASFNVLNPSDQARTILQADVKELRKDVKVLNDPAPIAEYRRSLQVVIFKGCAAAGCHGGPQGGKFFLYNPAESDAAAYTNFYLLTQFRMNVGGAQHLMIDRTYPESSLLALLGLPAEISKVPHPDVNGAPLRPIFRGKDDPNYRALMDWMGKSLVLMPGDYGINFSMDGKAAPPKGTVPPATRPVTPPPPAKTGV